MLMGGGRDRVPVSHVTVVRHITVSVSRTTQLVQSEEGVSVHPPEINF